MRRVVLAFLFAVLPGLAGCAVPAPERPVELTGTTSDGVTVFGTVTPARTPEGRPTVMLFHQGGSNGRGEYATIAPWLAENGFTSIAWDTRTGGPLYGSENRSVPTVPEGVPADFCDAGPDLDAALRAADAAGYDGPMILWGSSYTGGLVFHAAADHPARVAGVIAFSPASGAPVRACLAAARAGEVEAPMLVVQPSSEIAFPTATEQREILEGLGARYIVVENGVHGSSILVDDRREADSSALRAEVLDWLKGL